MKKKSFNMRKELNYGSSFPVWRFYHEQSQCDNQTSLSSQPSLYRLDVSSASDTQTKHLGWKPPQKKVIAMVANVAAFGLCGSSQNVGTEVKSSLKEVWEGKRRPSSVLVLHQNRMGGRPSSYVSGENVGILNLSRPEPTLNYGSLKTLTSWEKWKTWHSTHLL